MGFFSHWQHQSETPTTMRNDKDNVIVQMTFSYAVDIIHFAESLESKRKFVVGNQLLRCGTAIGAMVHESQNAESKADFVHKMKIAAKECDETIYWLKLCKAAYAFEHCDTMLSKASQIMLILSKIISTSKN